MTVAELRALLQMKRKGDEIDADPMKTKPKGLQQMLKANLIAQAKTRSLTPDAINPTKKTWEKITRDELILGIADHVNLLNGKKKAVLHQQTPTASSANTREISSDDEEFMDVTLEESPPPKTGRRKRQEETNRRPK